MANIPNQPPLPTTWKQAKNNLNSKENISLSEGLNAISAYFKQKSGPYIITSRTQRNMNDLETLLTKKIESETDIMIPAPLLTQLNNMKSLPDCVYKFLKTNVNSFNTDSKSNLRSIVNNHMQTIINSANLTTEEGKKAIIELINNIDDTRLNTIDSEKKYKTIELLLTKLNKHNIDFDILKTLFKNINKFEGGYLYEKTGDLFPQTIHQKVNTYLLDSLETLTTLPNEQQENNSSKEFAFELILDMVSSTTDYDMYLSDPLKKLTPINTTKFKTLLNNYLSKYDRQLRPQNIIKKWIETHFDWFRSCEEFKDIAIDNIPPPT